MKEKNIFLLSTMENVDIYSPSGEFVLTNLLNASEFESKLIGKRVKDALQKYKEDGNDLGKVPFGKKVSMIESKRKFIIDEYENDIIQFILLCRKTNTHINELNNHIKKFYINNEEEFTPIILNKKNYLLHPLTFENIAELLNSYNIEYRKKKWTKNIVYKIFTKNFII